MKKLLLSLALTAACSATLASNYIRMPMPTLKAGVATSHPATEALPAATDPVAPSGLLFSASALDLGVVTLGSQSLSAMVTVKNQGKDAVDVGNDPSLGLGGAFRLISNTCIGALAGGAQCAFTVYFQPTVAGRDQTASVSIGGKSVVFNASAKVATYGQLQATSAWQNGTNVVLGGSLPTVLTLKNSGTVPVILGAASFAPGEWALNTTVPVNLRDSCSNKTLAVGATCMVRMVFKPTSVGSQLRTSSFQMPNNATDEFGVAGAQVQALSFSGIVTPAGTGALYIDGSTNPSAPTSYTFAKGSTNAISISHYNKGDQPLVISNTVMTSSYSEQPTTLEPCKITLAVTNYCPTQYTLPDMPVGVYNMVYRVDNNGYTGPVTAYYYRVEIK